MVGKPYIWGGDDPMKGFDCSGFVQECLDSIGLDPKGDQTAQALYNYYRHSKTHEAKKGNILFFGKDSVSITHTAICLNSILMIEAGGGRSTTKTIQDAINQNAFIRVRPITNRADLIAIVNPF